MSKLPISRRQVERNVKKSLQVYSQDIMANFSETAKSIPLLLHFDGKTMKDFTDNVKRVVERLPVVVSSPDLEDPQVLGSVALEGQTGQDIVDGITALLEQYDLCDRITAMSFDTTSTNTGKNKGACVLLESYLERAVLWLACRRHILELHVKHVGDEVAKVVSQRKTTGPENKLFSGFRERWPEILPTIDLQNLTKFDWNRVAGTALEDQAHHSLQMLSRMLQDKVFEHEDYLELNELCVLYLGGVVRENFKFQYPGPIHCARFMAQLLYYLKMALLSHLIHFEKEEEKQEVVLMAEYTALFHTLWWLQGYLSSAAPRLDVLAISQMHMYKEFNPLVANVCLTSWSRHTWYLAPETVVFCLVDEEYEERDDVAMKVSEQQMPNSFTPGKPKLPLLSDEFWESKEDGKAIPKLSKLVSSRSLLVFHLLNFSPEEMEWLKLPSGDWEHEPGYIKFSHFVKKISVVNDAAERTVKATEQVVHKSRDEDVRQDMLIVNSEDRKLHKNRGRV